MRKKVKLAFIVNDSARKISSKKRTKSLMKKLDELSTLCGIEACAIVYSEFDPQPEVWPSPQDVLRVVTKFWNAPKMEQKRKMLNQESFLKKRILKVEKQLEKVRKDNREKEMSFLMFQHLAGGKVLDNLSMVDLNDLGWQISKKQEQISARMSALEKKASTTQSQAQVVAPTMADGVTRQGEVAQVNHGQRFEMNMNATQIEPWLLDLIHDGETEMLPFGDVNYHNK